MRLESTISFSCGVLRVTGLYDRNVEGFLNKWKSKAFKYYESEPYPPWNGRYIVKGYYPLVIFSDSVVAGNGRFFAKELGKYGKVVVAGPVVNPNSRNKIEVFTWVPSEKFKKACMDEANANTRKIET